MKEYLDFAASFINRVGFPIFIALVLLWRDDQRHKENVDALRDLMHTVKDQHLAIHCREEAERLARLRQTRRPKERRR